MIERNDPCWCGSGKKYKKCHLFSDQENRRAEKPRQKGVKTPQEITGMRRAGEFNGEVLDHIRPYIKAGITTEEIDRLVHEFTVKHGHKPATLGYRGYPKSCCVSRNNVVCHGIPSPDEKLEEGDIVNVDLTSIVNGYYGDSSETFMIGEVSDEARHLVEVTARALILGIDAVKPGVPLCAIGEAIEPFVKSQGCSVVRQYTGHGIGKRFHEFFTIYHHVDPDCEDVILQPGMTFTVEPMINLGGYEVVTSRKDGWTVTTKDKSLSAQFEHTVLVTETGVDVLTLTPSEKEAGIRLRAAGIDYK
ncbi:MAG: type I methionyl aminopeptidase [Chitinispirillaceae bacterium]